MNVVLVSEDAQIQNTTVDNIDNKYDLTQYSGSAEPLEVMSRVCTSYPNVIIIDDDFLTPNSARILHSIKSILPEVKFIFFTSNSSIELGREISPLGIHFYGIKPILKFDYIQVLQSITKLTSVN